MAAICPRAPVGDKTWNIGTAMALGYYVFDPGPPFDFDLGFCGGNALDIPEGDGRDGVRRGKAVTGRESLQAVEVRLAGLVF